MPPEIQAFIQATGRLPQSETDLQSFLATQPGGGFSVVGGGFNTGPPAIPFGADPSAAGPQLPLSIPETSGAVGFRTGGPPPDFSFQPFPDVARRRGIGLEAPGGPPAPELAAGAQAGVPAGPTAASQQQAAETGPLSSLAPVFGNVAGGVARARLGGGADGFSFTQGAAGPPAQPSLGGGGGGANVGALPGVGPTGSGDVLTDLGRQQQADVANQQQLAASLLGALLGGGGALGGGALAGGGQGQPPQDKTILVGNQQFDPTLRASALGRIR